MLRQVRGHLVFAGKYIGNTVGAITQNFDLRVPAHVLDGGDT
jgi:hypothetical protein